MGTLSELANEWFERVWNNCDAEYIDTALAQSCELTGLTPEPIKSPADFHQFHEMLNSVFRDIHVDIDHLLENDDICSGVVSVRAVHRSTDKLVHLKSSFFSTFRDGQIYKVTNLVDYLSVLIQVGAIPPDIIEKGFAGETVL